MPRISSPSGHVRAYRAGFEVILEILPHDVHAAGVLAVRTVWC